MLAGGRTSATRIATDLGIDEQAAIDRLEHLRRVGLVTRLEGAVPEYAAVDPRFSIRALVDRLAEEAMRIRDTLPALVEYFDTASAPDAWPQQTFVVTDPDAVAAWYARLQHQATREFLAFDRPPYVSASLDPLQSVVLARGVVWKAIYTIDSFDVGATWDEIEALGDLGEQARVTGELPVKLVVVDGEVALVSLTLEPGRVEVLLTQSLPLVDAFRRLFELEWARAVPVPDAAPDRDRPAARGFPSSRGRAPSTEERSILTLMAVGMKDEAIARQLGISARTLRRRGQELLAELGAGNRFQAGIEAARRGWI